MGKLQVKKYTSKPPFTLSLSKGACRREPVEGSLSKGACRRVLEGVARQIDHRLLTGETVRDGFSRFQFKVPRRLATYIWITLKYCAFPPYSENKMMMKKIPFKPALILVWLPLLFACGDYSETPATRAEAPKDKVPEVAAVHASGASAIPLDVYKSPTCGCCGLWVDHAAERGFSLSTLHPADLNKLKAGKGIAPEVQSCHTAVSAEGYVFEGHIPARFIRDFLAEPPAGARGLAVPAMPVGSPGMEVDDRFMAYDVLLLKDDGSTEVYARVTTPAQQYQ